MTVLHAVISLRLGLIVAGAVVGLFGWLLTLTLIGAIIGLPMCAVGGIMLLAGLVSSGHHQVNVTQQVNTEQKIQIRCKKCGKLNSEDAEFCKHCGEKL